MTEDLRRENQWLREENARLRSGRATAEWRVQLFRDEIEWLRSALRQIVDIYGDRSSGVKTIALNALSVDTPATPD